jgi:hypothetical protein
MKLDRLYTLSQFVDKEHEELGWNTENVHKYNTFLKQPLTKEMFVSSIEKPIQPENDSEKWYEYFRILLPKYNGAQAKVIFDGWEKDDQDFYIHDNYVIDFDTYDYSYILFTDVPDSFGIKTLHDLAEATRGKLKLKAL